MQKYLFLIFCASVATALWGEKTTIELTVLAEESLELPFYPTLDGYFFAGAAKKVVVNPGRTLTLSFESVRPGLNYLQFANWNFPGTGGGFTVYTEPGDVVRISFGKNNPQETLRISGHQLGVNSYLAKTKRPDVTPTYMDKYWLTEPNAAILGRQIEVSLKKEWVNLFNSPLKNHPARPYLEADMYWWHLNILNDLAVRHMERHGSTLADWESVFLLFNGQEPNPSYSRASFWFGEAMAGLVQGYYLDRLSTMRALGQTADTGVIGAIMALDQHFKQKTAAETFLAKALAEYRYSEILPVYEWVQQAFPGGLATVYFGPVIEPIQAFERNYQPGDSSLLYLPEPARWQSLVDSLKGNIVWVYLWKSDHTYCLECRESMVTAEKWIRSSDGQLQALFVSLDSPDAYAHWHRQFSFNQWAFGKHILAKGPFRQDVLNRLPPGQELPAVFILDQEGFLLTNDGPGPNDSKGMQLLFQALLSRED